MTADERTTMFLTPIEIVQLTGIRGGRKGLTRAQRQVEALKSMSIPCHVNAAGRPVVARAVIEGAAKAQIESAARDWQPAVMRGPRLIHG